MVVATLLLTLTALGDLPRRQEPVIAVLSQPAGVSSHLVVPTGIAVPLDRRDGAPSSSDLFRLPIRTAVATLSVGGKQVSPLSIASPEALTISPLCRL